MTATATWSCCGATAAYPTALAAATAPHRCAPPPPATEPAPVSPQVAATQPNPRWTPPVPARPARRRPRAAVTGATATATGTLAQIGA